MNTFFRKFQKGFRLKSSDKTQEKNGDLKLDSLDDRLKIVLGDYQDFDQNSNYLVGNKVKYDGFNYICIQDTTNQNPTDIRYWEPFEGEVRDLLLSAQGTPVDNLSKQIIENKTIDGRQSSGNNIVKADASDVDFSGSLGGNTQEALDSLKTLMDSAIGTGPTISGSVNQLLDVDTTTISPTEGQVLTWDDNTGNWVPKDRVDNLLISKISLFNGIITPDSVIVDGFVFDKNSNISGIYSYTCYRRTEQSEETEVGFIYISNKYGGGVLTLEKVAKSGDCGIEFTVDQLSGQVSYQNTFIEGVYYYGELTIKIEDEYAI